MQDYSYSLQTESESEEVINVTANRAGKRKIVVQDRNGNGETATGSKRVKSDNIPSDIAAAIRYIDEVEKSQNN